MWLSHTSPEAILFVDGHIRTNKDFTEFLEGVFPSSAKQAGVVGNITRFYPPVTSDSSSLFRTQTDRFSTLLRDRSFTCNVRVRYLAQAYKGKTYHLQYSQDPGWHGTDLFAIFVIAKSSSDIPRLLAGLFYDNYDDVFDFYQSYLVSYIMNGDPNAQPTSSRAIKTI